MRKRKFAGGIVALCLVLSVAGCGKTSEEKQAANYYQKELGLDKDEAEELAHEIYGKDKDEEKPSATEAPEETVIEPLTEIVNSEWWERKVQILDMVFTKDEYLTEEVIRKTVAGSAYNVEIKEKFDSRGEICIDGIMLDGKQIFWFFKSSRPSDLVSSGLYEAGDYYYFNLNYHPDDNDKTIYTKAFMDIEALDFKTRDDVLAYLAENGFVEVEGKPAPYNKDNTTYYGGWGEALSVKEDLTEFADVSHYVRNGARSIVFYRVHRLDENEFDYIYFHNIYGNKGFSGCHRNLYQIVNIIFNTDGTIYAMQVYEAQECVIPGERIPSE